MKRWLCSLLSLCLLTGLALPALATEETSAEPQAQTVCPPPETCPETTAELPPVQTETVTQSQEPAEPAEESASTQEPAEPAGEPASTQEPAEPAEGSEPTQEPAQTQEEQTEAVDEAPEPALPEVGQDNDEAVFVGAGAGYDPYTDAATFAARTHNTRYARYDVVTGIDVSTYQKDINWKKVAADGVDFAIIRIGGRFSKTGLFYDDSRFQQNIKNALDAGLQVGVYFFSQAVTAEEAREEAAWTMEKLGDWADDLTLPVYLDVEYVNNQGRLHDANLTTAQQTKVALAFCDAIKARGLDAGVYASFLSFGISAKDLTAAGYSVWHAHWNTSTGMTGWYDLWQFSAAGVVAGVSTEVDMNFLYRKSCLTAFTDVSLSAWYTPSVRYALENKLFFGVSDVSFAPDSPMTREMFVTVLYRMAGAPAVSGESAFRDVADASAYYYAPVLWAAKNGLVSGLSADSFGVGQAMTRQEMAAFMYRYARWKGLDAATSGTGTAAFEDAQSVSVWAADAMNWAVENGVLYGVSETQLSPAGISTRAQVAAVLMRLAGILSA